LHFFGEAARNLDDMIAKTSSTHFGPLRRVIKKRYAQRLKLSQNLKNRKRNLQRANFLTQGDMEEKRTIRDLPPSAVRTAVRAATLRRKSLQNHW